jgi:hypothetical protein
LIPTPLLRSIKISRSGFFILSNPNSLSPKKKRKHNNACRQRRRDTKARRGGDYRHVVHDTLRGCPRRNLMSSRLGDGEILVAGESRCDAIEL